MGVCSSFINLERCQKPKPSTSETIFSSWYDARINILRSLIMAEPTSHLSSFSSAGQSLSSKGITKSEHAKGLNSRSLSVYGFFWMIVGTPTRSAKTCAYVCGQECATLPTQKSCLRCLRLNVVLFMSFKTQRRTHALIKPCAAYALRGKRSKIPV